MLQAIVDYSNFMVVMNFYEAMTPRCVQRIAEEMAIEGETYMKQRAPVGKTRRTVESIRRIRIGSASWAIAPWNVPWLPYLVFGTRPHTIYPRTAQALRWIDEESGEARFAKVVHHPGTMPNPFMWDTLDYVGSRAGDIAQRVMRSMGG